MSKMCTAEISLYPLQDSFLDVIGDFIQALKKYEEFTFSVSTTSTQIRGPYALLFSVLGEEIEKVHKQTGQAILVCKFLAGDDVAVGIHQSHKESD